MLRAAVATRFLLFATILGAAFLVPQYLQLAHGYGPLRTGLSLLPFTGPMMAIAPIAGKAADRLGARADRRRVHPRRGRVHHARPDRHRHRQLPPIAGPLLLAGVGVGLAVPTTVSASLRAVAPQQAGLASGVGSTLQNIGGVFGVATATAIFAAAGSYLTPAGFVHGLRPALLALAILAALGAFAGHAVRRPAPPSR